jgi:hypothetical protein
MSADADKLIERLDNYSMDWRDRAKDEKPVRDAIAGIRALLDRIASLEAALEKSRDATIAECVAALLAEAGRIKAIPWADRFNLKHVAYDYGQAADLLAALSTSNGGRG